MTEQTLRRELADSFHNRAHLYRLLLDSLERRMTPDAAEAVLSEVCHARGREVAAAAFARFGPGDAPALGEAFLAASPDGGRLYPTEVERRPEGISFRVLACPLKAAWQSAGLPAERIAVLCRIAGTFDRGLFEATGVRFANRTWRPADGEGCCHIHLDNAEP
jgi:hypothetical protein